MTVKQALLHHILNTYPITTNYNLENAHPEHPLSGLRILRRMKDDGVAYEVKGSFYDFSGTPRSWLELMLRVESVK